MRIMIAMLAGLFAASCATVAPSNGVTPDASLSDAAKVAVVHDMIDAWNTQDWERVVALFAEDGSLHSMMVDPIVGRESIGARIMHIAEGIEAIELQPRHIGVIDGVVVVERVDAFVFNGHAGSVPVVGVIEVGDDGLINEWREYYDRAELLEAMGIATDFDANAR